MKNSEFNASKNHTKSLIDKLFKLAKEKSKSGDVDYDEDTLESLKQLEDVTDIWGIDIEKKELSSIERIGSMYGGFPYTSDKYPWPTNSNGQYLCPLVQINLDRLSEDIGEEHGTGLLQVWIDITKTEISDELRIVPTSEYNKQRPDECYRGYSQGDDDDGWGEWENYCDQIKWRYSGKVCADWEPYDLFIVSRDEPYGGPSEEENEIIDQLYEYAQQNRPIENRNGYLFGHPTTFAIGAMGNFYEAGSSNFLSIGYKYFPPAEVGASANIFFWNDGKKNNYWFQWGRG